MRYSKSILLLLVLTLFVLTACSSGTQTTSGNPYIGGTQALALSFISGAPPAQIYDNKQSPFQVTVNVKNVGEYDLATSDGYIQIEGIAPQEYGVTSADFKQDMPAIPGAKKTGSGTIVDGNQQLVTFGTLTYQQNINGNIGSNKIIATACYNYVTRATSTLCVTKSGLDDPAQKNVVCTIDGTKSVSNSAGPIQVTDVKQIQSIKGKIQVQFTVGKVSTATNELFFKKNTNCDDSQTNLDKYKIYINVLPIVNSMYAANCIGWQDGGSGASGYFTLFDGAPRQMQCSFDVGTVSTDYQTPVNFELGYRYMQQIETPILIKDVSTGNN